jgi:ketosteroid isomerase-like protein
MVVLLGLLVAPGTAAQEPPAAAPAPAVSADDVADEVQEFYREYWKAWDNGDVLAIANALSKEFVSLSHTPQGIVQVDKPGAVAGLRRFFEAVRDKESVWARNLLSIVPRSSTEAIAAVRNDFSLGDAGTESELTLEVLRKGPDNRWRLVRKWSERRGF